MVNSWVNWGWYSYYHHHYHPLSTYFHYQIEYNPLPSSVKIGFTHIAIQNIIKYPRHLPKAVRGLPLSWLLVDCGLLLWKSADEWWVESVSLMVSLMESVSLMISSLVIGVQVEESHNTQNIKLKARVPFSWPSFGHVVMDDLPTHSLATEATTFPNWQKTDIRMRSPRCTPQPLVHRWINCSPMVNQKHHWMDKSWFRIDE